MHLHEKLDCIHRVNAKGSVIRALNRIQHKEKENTMISRENLTSTASTAN